MSFWRWLGGVGDGCGFIALPLRARLREIICRVFVTAETVMEKRVCMSSWTNGRMAGGSG
jgi:hypothetical protein